MCTWFVDSGGTSWWFQDVTVFRMWQFSECDSFQNVTVFRMWQFSECGSFQNVTVFRMWQFSECDSFQNVTVFRMWQFSECGSFHRQIISTLTYFYQWENSRWILNGFSVVLKTIYFSTTVKYIYKFSFLTILKHCVRSVWDFGNYRIIGFKNTFINVVLLLFYSFFLSVLVTKWDSLNIF
jgi:hypothetical protein